jgi:protein-glutamine gamma-glutamyltransferase
VDGLDSAFQRLEQQLGKLGLERQPAETTRKWLVRLQKQFPEAVAMQLQELIDLHYRYRFDPQGISAEERAQLKSMLQSCLRATRVTPKPQH